jgi:hypothetical protein
MEELILNYLRSNPELKENLKPGTETQLIEKIASQGYAERAGELVDIKTNLAASPELVIRTHGREFLKSRGQGRYIPKYADRRSPDQREKDKTEFKKILNEYASRLGQKYISDEPQRILIEHLANNFLYENDGKGSFYIVATLNGVPVERYTPEQVFSKLNRYLDQDKTRIEEKRISARIRNNALDLEGLTFSDLNDPRKKAALDNTVKLLEKEYYSIPTLKKLPSIRAEMMESDLSKQGAYEAGLPLEEKEWTLNDKIKLSAYATNRIEQAKRESWEKFESFVNERTPEFYKSVFEKFSGLEY